MLASGFSPASIEDHSSGASSGPSPEPFVKKFRSEGANIGLSAVASGYHAFDIDVPNSTKDTVATMEYSIATKPTPSIASDLDVIDEADAEAEHLLYNLKLLDAKRCADKLKDV